MMKGDENLKVLTVILFILTFISVLALIGDYQCKKSMSGLFTDF